jgi:hypothetical protein
MAAAVATPAAVVALAAAALVILAAAVRVTAAVPGHRSSIKQVANGVWCGECATKLCLQLQVLRMGL